MEATVKRIYPESKTALINWVEQHFHEIDEYVVQFQMKDGKTFMIYDAYTYRNAIGMIEMAKEELNDLHRNEEFIQKFK